MDKPYTAGKGGATLQDVALMDKDGEIVGSFVRDSSRWKHGGCELPRDVRSWAKEKFGFGITSVDSYMCNDPLGFIAIMLDIAGDHDGAAEIDDINGEL